MKYRPSLIHLMGLVATLAVGLAAMKVATGWVARGVVLGALVALLAATLGAIVRRRGRAAWVGFAVFGWGHLLFAGGLPSMLADVPNRYKGEDPWAVDVAVTSLAEGMHPEPPSPADPFRGIVTQFVPSTGRHSKMVDGAMVPFTPEEIRIQADYESRSAVHVAGVEAAARARWIGLTLQGLAFACAGALAGHALADPPAHAPEARPSPTPG